MDTYRRFRLLDPQLPGRLLPPDWLRQPAGDLFTAVYDGLVEVAQTHVRSVVADLTGAPSPDVRAHTVAELLARISAPPHP
jgi:phenylacetic acid degradation operon negative regulatory protein